MPSPHPDAIQQNGKTRKNWQNADTNSFATASQPTTQPAHQPLGEQYAQHQNAKTAWTAYECKKPKMETRLHITWVFVFVFLFLFVFVLVTLVYVESENDTIQLLFFPHSLLMFPFPSSSYIPSTCNDKWLQHVRVFKHAPVRLSAWCQLNDWMNDIFC